MSLIKSTTTSMMLAMVMVLGAAVDASPQNGRAAGYPAPARRIPILYEAYYPEQRELSPQATLQEIQKLRELTSRLLREEEQLGQIAAAAAEAAPENVFEPRGQILEYVFSRPPLPSPALQLQQQQQQQQQQALAPAAIGQLDEQQSARSRSAVEVDADVPRSVGGGSGGDDDVQVASITVSDSGRHKTRHHHGRADWLLRRLAPVGQL